MSRYLRASLVLIFAVALSAFGQINSESSTAVPRLIKFSGTVKAADGSPRTGVVGITFALYAEQDGGTPLWMETQNLNQQLRLCRTLYGA